MADLAVSLRLAATGWLAAPAHVSHWSPVLAQTYFPSVHMKLNHCNNLWQVPCLSLWRYWLDGQW